MFLHLNTQQNSAVLTEDKAFWFSNTFTELYYNFYSDGLHQNTRPDSVKLTQSSSKTSTEKTSNTIYIMYYKTNLATPASSLTKREGLQC